MTKYTVWAWQWLRFPNDRNGNPRRLFLIYGKNTELLAVIDEGYTGMPQSLNKINQLPTMDLVTGYREWKRVTTLLSYKHFL